jgi:hypothetical protein
MKGLDTHDTDDATENIRLLKIDVDEVGGAFFNMCDSFPYVTDFQFRRQCSRASETFGIEFHLATNVSRFKGEYKLLLGESIAEGISLNNRLAFSIESCKQRDAVCRHLEKGTVML